MSAERRPTEPKNWKPRTKVEEGMARRYRGWSTADRMTEAVRLVLDDGISQAEAGRRLGVSRPRINVNVKGAREARDTVQERADRARSARVAANEAVNEPDGQVRTDIGTVEPEFEPAARVPLEAHQLNALTFPEFNARYFGNEVCPDCMVHHDTPGFHTEIMELLSDMGKRHKLINLAPYHAKSTTTTVKWVLYLVCMDPSIRIALISRASDLAEAFLYQIKGHMSDHDLYIGAEGDMIEDFGPFVNTNQWSAKQIYILGRSAKQKDPTISVYGFGKQIYGRRFDVMIFDDVADLENQNTPESIAKMYKKIWQEYSNRVGKTGQIVWVGTRVAPGDIYSLLDDVESMNVLRFPCIVDEENKLTLWSEHFPYSAALAQRTAMSEQDFQLVYQNVDTPGIGASFTQEVMDRSHDTGRVIGEMGAAWALIIGLDPAGANAQAGYTAMVGMAVDLNDGKRHLVDIVNVKQMKAPQVIAQIIDWAERYAPRELRVEVNGLQAQIYQYNDVLNAALANKGIRLVPHITHKGNKWDPQFGVEAMATLYHNQMITTPWGDANSRVKFRELEQQLMQFPMGKVNDLVMAMWFASLGCSELHQRTQLPMFDGRHKVPGRIRRRRGVIDFGNKAVRAPTREEENRNIFGPGPSQLPAHRFVNVPGATHPEVASAAVGG